jgi:hypothetical protein
MAARNGITERSAAIERWTKRVWRGCQNRRPSLADNAVQVLYKECDVKTLSLPDIIEAEILKRYII